MSSLGLQRPELSSCLTIGFLYDLPESNLVSLVPLGVSHFAEGELSQKGVENKIH